MKPPIAPPPWGELRPLPAANCGFGDPFRGIRFRPRHIRKGRRTPGRMEMISKLDDAFRFHQVALNLRAERQQILASNIANASTPNYKARDIDFAPALQQALGGK